MLYLVHWESINEQASYKYASSPQKRNYKGKKMERGKKGWADDSAKERFDDVQKLQWVSELSTDRLLFPATHVYQEICFFWQNVFSLLTSS